VEPALKSVPITNHPNALKSLWKMMKPVIIDTAFTGRLNACDTTGDDHETTSRCKASNFTLMQVRLRGEKYLFTSARPFRPFCCCCFSVLIL
jgi:hypothetical protein